ncbi:IclR family transcriptional regulator [Halorarius litoreus]|uniref:IclR family transcriptional regulator n=1 Tax=Halorarius litoreus TaxID=2962676 RepID=UPI0020CD032D|nr:IclR family transcriptional regulator [Halorarius litoreus]
MTNKHPNPRTVKTADTAFSILEKVLEADGATITQLAAELGMAKSTVHRHLQTLYEREYVVREGDTYHVSLRFLEFGEHARTRNKGYRLVKEKVEQLAEETEERVQFIVEEHGYGVYVYRATGSRGVQTDPGIGKRIPLHAIAAGKAILAYLPTEQVETILEKRGLPGITANTTTDREALFRNLETIRRDGFSVNNQENVEGLRAIGVPIKDKDGSVLGALSISGPTHRMKGEWFEDELPNLLLGTANELELNIAYA